MTDNDFKIEKDNWTKKDKKRFKRIYKRCNESQPCDCGMGVLCEHTHNMDGLCDIIYCPKMQK